MRTLICILLAGCASVDKPTISAEEADKVLAEHGQRARDAEKKEIARTWTPIIRAMSAASSPTTGTARVTGSASQ